MHNLLQNLRYCFRMIIKSPSFASVIILTLGLGIGANTAIFSLINAVMMKQLPVHNPDELVVVGNPISVHSRTTNGPPRADVFSYQLYKDLRDNNTVFAGMLASGEILRTRVARPGPYGGSAISEQTITSMVSRNYFSVLGISAVRGRTFGDEVDDVPDAHPVAVISYGFWMEKLGGDPGIVGQQLLFNNFPLTVIGIAPPGFTGDTVGDRQDAWFPVTMQAELISGRQWLNGYQNSWLHIIGRLRPGIKSDQAYSNINVIFQHQVDGPMGSVSQLSDRATLRRLKIDVSDGSRGFSQLRGRYQEPLWLLMGIVGLVLLIACVNVANLLLVRALSRRKEVAIRLALGAPSWKLVAQLLTESISLAFLGGIFGLAVANAGISALLQMTRVVDTPVEIDTRVLLFTGALCIVTGVLFGLVPALRAVDVNVVPALKSSTEQGRSFSANPMKWNWGRVFIATQIAICVWVLFTAGLLVRSMKNLRQVDIGLIPENIAAVRVDQISGGYKTAEQRAEYCERIANRFSNLPGATSVTYSQNGLYVGNDALDSIKVDGFVPRANEDGNSRTDRVGPNYFSTLHIPLIRGREIDYHDTEFAPRVAVVNQSWVRFYSGNSDPIGKKISIIDTDKIDVYQIVGIVGDAKDQALRADAPRRFYVPIAQSPDSQGFMTFMVRVSGDAGALLDTLRKSVRTFDSNVPILEARLLPSRIDESIQSDITVSRLSSFFAIVALSLACIGLYGVMAYSVAGKTRAIGIRMALGAQRTNVLWMVLKDAIKLVGIGLILGIPVALVSSNLLSSFLYELSSTDPISLIVVVMILFTVAIASSYFPARRATKVDPLIALRDE